MTRFRVALLGLAMALAAPMIAHAVQPDEILPDPGLERFAPAKSRVACAAWSPGTRINNSNAPLARDLRLLVRELKKGDSDDQVRDYLVARYGDFVLLKPPLRPYTLILGSRPCSCCWARPASRSRDCARRSLRPWRP